MKIGKIGIKLTVRKGRPYSQLKKDRRGRQYIDARKAVLLIFHMTDGSSAVLYPPPRRP